MESTAQRNGTTQTRPKVFHGQYCIVAVGHWRRSRRSSRPLSSLAPNLSPHPTPAYIVSIPVQAASRGFPDRQRRQGGGGGSLRRGQGEGGHLRRQQRRGQGGGGALPRQEQEGAGAGGRGEPPRGPARLRVSLFRFASGVSGWSCTWRQGRSSEHADDAEEAFILLVPEKA